MVIAEVSMEESRQLRVLFEISNLSAISLDVTCTGEKWARFASQIVNSTINERKVE